MISGKDDFIFNFCHSVTHHFLCQYSFLVGELKHLKLHHAEEAAHPQMCLGPSWGEVWHIAAPSAFLQVQRVGRVWELGSAVMPDVINTTYFSCLQHSLYPEVAAIISFLILHTLPFNIINLQDLQPAIPCLIPGMYGSAASQTTTSVLYKRS